MSVSIEELNEELIKSSLNNFLNVVNFIFQIIVEKNYLKRHTNIIFGKILKKME